MVHTGIVVVRRVHDCDVSIYLARKNDGHNHAYSSQLPLRTHTELHTVDGDYFTEDDAWLVVRWIEQMI